MIIIFMEKVFINGEMVVCIEVSGKIIKWKVKGFLLGMMVENTQVVI